MKFSAWKLILTGVLTGLCGAAFGTELILNEGEIVDLGSAKPGTKTFAFDKIVMKDKSLILIPLSMKNVGISINELRTVGTSYIYVYDDVPGTPLFTPSNQGTAPTCKGGVAGTTGPKGTQGAGAFDIDLTVGFSSIDKLILLAEGSSGGQGSNGGGGQDGGDSGGANQCVVQSCNGGDGGAGGKGGVGGDGGIGANIKLNYSGLSPDKIHLRTEGEYFYGALAQDLLNTKLGEKKIDGYSSNGRGLNTLVSLIGQTLDIQQHDTMPLPAGAPLFPSSEEVISFPKANTLQDMAEKGFTVIVAGGAYGGGGNTGHPGKGGAGFYCTIGHDQDVGKNGPWSGDTGANGAHGKAGKLTLNKLD